MTTVTIKRLPRFYIDHKIRPLFWQGPPPIFPNCGPDGPTEEEREVARELFRLLDPDSQQWYRMNCPRLFEGIE